MALANHTQRLSGDRVVVAPYARRVLVTPPAGARTLVVHAPAHAHGTAELSGWSLASGPIRPFGTEAPIERDGPLEIRLCGARDVDAGLGRAAGVAPVAEAAQGRNRDARPRASAAARARSLTPVGGRARPAAQFCR